MGVSEILVSGGVAAILTAILGGGLKAFGLEMPIVDSLKRQILLFSFGFIILTIGVLNIFSNKNSSTDNVSQNMQQNENSASIEIKDEDIGPYEVVSRSISGGPERCSLYTFDSSNSPGNEKQEFRIKCARNGKITLTTSALPPGYGGLEINGVKYTRRWQDVTGEGIKDFCSVLGNFDAMTDTCHIGPDYNTSKDIAFFSGCKAVNADAGIVECSTATR